MLNKRASEKLLCADLFASIQLNYTTYKTWMQNTLSKAATHEYIY